MAKTTSAPKSVKTPHEAKILNPGTTLGVVTVDDRIKDPGTI
jgi:hypothetical protein